MPIAWRRLDSWARGLALTIFSRSLSALLMSKLPYRPDIDGLRAIAVMAVVLFHANLGPRGGFVGVDVFFVISGFLITSLIQKDLTQGTFRFADFWERRSRRILPPLLAMVSVSTVVGWYLFLPNDFNEFGQSLAALGGFVSNLYFWSSAGYFGVASESKPLLHTWSLAVEEQFYIVFPLILFFARKLSRPRWGLLMLGLFLGSFALSVYGVYHWPSATFYCLPTRAWELLLGALLAVGMGSPRLVPTRKIAETASWAGLGAILFAIVQYSHKTRFPGVAALFPCVGTALIIWANGQHSTQLGRILSQRSFVLMGQMSYSFYLWHWPFLVYARYWALTPVTKWQSILVLLGAGASSVVSWLYVEQPFRKKSLLSRRRSLFVFSGCVSLIYIVIGMALHGTMGMPQRFPARAANYVNGVLDRVPVRDVTLQEVRAGQFLVLGATNGDQAKTFLVWGDSHAKAIIPLLDQLGAQYGLRGVGAVYSSTAPLLGFAIAHPASLRKDSISYAQAVVDFVRAEKIANVFLVAKWKYYAIEPSGHPGENGFQGDFGPQLKATVEALRQAGATAWIMKDVPIHPYDIPRALASQALFHQPAHVGLSVNDHGKILARFDQILAQIGEENLRCLDPTPSFATRDGYFVLEQDGYPLYMDFQHLSTHGALFLKPLFEPVLRGFSQSTFPQPNRVPQPGAPSARFLLPATSGPDAQNVPGQESAGSGQ